MAGLNFLIFLYPVLHIVFTYLPIYFVHIVASLSLQGTIFTKDSVQGNVVVSCYKLQVLSNGVPVPIYFNGNFWIIRPQVVQTFGFENGSASFRFSLEEGYYSVFAYLDVNKNGNLDLDKFEPVGWYQAVPAARLSVIHLNTSVQSYTIYLQYVIFDHLINYRFQLL